MFKNVDFNVARQHTNRARKRYFEKTGEDILLELINKQQKLTDGNEERGKCAQNKCQTENAHKLFSQALEKSA